MAGREKVYTQDSAALVAAGAKLNKVVISKKGDDGKTYNQGTVEVESPVTYAQALAFCGNSEDEFGTLFAQRIINPMLQANDRRALAVAAEGPAKAIETMVANLVKGGAYDNDADARAFVIERLIAKGTLPADYVSK